MHAHSTIRQAAFFLATLSLPSILAAADLVKPLETVLNSAEYSVVNPARTNVLPAGFVVAKGSHATYNGLDKTWQARFSLDAFTASIYSGAATKTIGISAFLSGLFKLAGGGTFSSQSQLSWDQIDVSGSQVTTSAVLADSDVKALVKGWINDKKNKYQVYIVESTISTSTVSINNSKGVDISGAVGTQVPKCQPPASSSTTSPSSSSTATNSASSTSSSPTTKGGGAPKSSSNSASSTNTSPTSSGTSVTNAAASATPSGTFCVDVATTSQVKLKSDSAKVIGAGLRKVAYDPAKDTLTAEPVRSIENERGAGGIVVDWSSKAHKP